ncbi:Uncharacterised protein [Mycobacteroides abscessus subsp. abscessus]|nr:Uncharacterised protein [Mycobacteroides abscessus subsp. abscessus]
MRLDAFQLPQHPCNHDNLYKACKRYTELVDEVISCIKEIEAAVCRKQYGNDGRSPASK